jgi:hypothetical protein
MRSRKREGERERKRDDNTRCLRSPSFRVVFMAGLTRTPLTYLNGGKDARERDYARLYLDIAKKMVLSVRVFNATSFKHRVMSQ